MAPIKGVRPRIHQPMAGYRHAPVRNPIETLRAPWKVKTSGTDRDDTFESPSWDCVNNIYANDSNKSERSHVLIEVRPIPPPDGARVGFGDAAGGEITVYFAEVARFREHYAEIEGTTDVDWIRENWSRRVSGECPDFYAGTGQTDQGLEAPEDWPGTGRPPKYETVVDRDPEETRGWRKVLQDFLIESEDARRARDEQGYHHPWDPLPASTPVVVHVPGDTPLVTTLNAARLGAAEAEVYDAIYGQAMARKEYEETNSDSVSDYPSAYMAGGTTGADRVVAGESYQAWSYGHGYRKSRDTEALRKLQDLHRLCDDENEKAVGDLFHKIREALKYTDIWCLSDPEDTKRPDDAVDLNVFEYQTEDMVEDQIEGDLVDKANDLPDASRARVVEALDRVDVRWDGQDVPVENLIYIGDVNAHWIFTINVDSLIEDMINDYPELAEDYEPEDEDDA